MKKYEYFERFENWKTKKAMTVVYNNELEEWECWEDVDGILTGRRYVNMRTHEEATEKAEEKTLEEIATWWKPDEFVCKVEEWGTTFCVDPIKYRKERLHELGKALMTERELRLKELERRQFVLTMIDRPNNEEREALRAVEREIKELGGTL